MSPTEAQAQPAMVESHDVGAPAPAPAQRPQDPEAPRRSLSTKSQTSSTPSSSPTSPQRQFTHHRQRTESTLCESPVSLTTPKKAVTVSTTASVPDAGNGDGFSARLAYRMDLLNDRWIWEILSCVVAMLCLLAIITILALYQDHPLPQLPALISINSMVAVFTAIMKAAVMVPVTQGVSQLKWLWFRKPRSLADMDDFDNASRGPWGSFLLILSLRKHYLASFGAFIAVVALATDPFSQQIIHFYSCNDIETATIARIPRTNNFTEGGQLTTPYSAELYSRMQASIYNSILGGDANGAASQVPFECQTGNCTFPADSSGATFQTLGMCHTCEELPDEQIQRNATSPVYWIPRGDGDVIDVGWTVLHNGAPNYEQPWGVVNTKSSGPSKMPMGELMKIRALMLQAPQQNAPGSACPRPQGKAGDPTTACLPKPKAYQCTMSPCVRTYGAKIESGVLKENLLASTPLRKTNASDPAITTSNSSLTFSLASDRILRNGEWHTCARSNTPSALTPVAIDAEAGKLYLPSRLGSAASPQGPPPIYTQADCVWFLGYESGLAINRFVSVMFDKRVISAESNELSATQGPVWIKNLSRDGHATLETIDDYFHSLAGAITAIMRQQGQQSGSGSISATPSASMTSSGFSDGDDAGNAALGSVVVAQTCVAVRWGWLSLPVALVCMTMVFLGATMARCVSTGSLDGAWRSSSLAPFFHGLDPATREGLGEVSRQSDMMDAARGIRVRVVPMPGAAAGDEEANNNDNNESRSGRARRRRRRNQPQGLEVVTVVSRRNTFATLS